MGIDVAWGDTSKFAIVITQYRNNKVEVFYAEELRETTDERNHGSLSSGLNERHHTNKDLCGWCQSRK